MLVSVVIPAFNGARWIATAITSVQQQSVPTEILVIDDGSTDDTAAVARGLGVTVIGKRNGGTASARNVGVAAATGEIIALLDQDDYWLPGKLEAQLAGLADPRVGLVQTGVRFVDEASTVLSEWLPPAELSTREVLSWCDVSAQSALMPRRVVDQVGPFDEALSGSDDWDFWIRISRAGHRVVGVQSVLTVVVGHTGNQTQALEHMYAKLSGVIAKHAGIDAPATKAARRKLGADYYTKARSVAQRPETPWLTGLGLTAKGLARNPHALIETPGYHLARLRAHHR